MNVFCSFMWRVGGYMNVFCSFMWRAGGNMNAFYLSMWRTGGHMNVFCSFMWRVGGHMNVFCLFMWRGGGNMNVFYLSMWRVGGHMNVFCSFMWRAGGDIQENAGQWKPVFLHILYGAMDVALVFTFLTYSLNYNFLNYQCVTMYNNAFPRFFFRKIFSDARDGWINSR